MDGFTKLPKMQHFKEGGSVQREVKNFTKRDRKSVEEADTKQDKKIVKKAFGMHDSQQHDGEKTDLTALKKGGRAKKKEGTVKKFCGGGNAYKEGGSVTNVYEAKKSSGDLDNIEKVKGIKPGKAAAPSKATEKPNFEGSDVKKTNKMSSGSTKAKEVSARPKDAAATSGAKGGPNKYKTGGGVKKFADGGSDGYLTPAQERTLKMVKTGNYRSKPNEMNYAQPAPSSNGPTMPSLGPANNFPSSEAYRQAGSPAPQAQKKGGKVKKMAVGGSALNDLMQAKELARLANARKYLNKDQQGQFAAGEMQQTPAMTGLGQTPAPMPAPAVQAPGGTSPAGAIPAQKRGGKVKKMNTGGTAS